jgi:hypothetical protein
VGFADSADLSELPLLGSCREYALGAGEPYGTWGGMTEADRKLGSSFDPVGDRCVIVPWVNRKSTLRSPLGRGMVFEILLRRRCIKEAIR